MLKQLEEIIFYTRDLLREIDPKFEISVTKKKRSILVQSKDSGGIELIQSLFDYLKANFNYEVTEYSILIYSLIELTESAVKKIKSYIEGVFLKKASHVIQNHYPQVHQAIIEPDDDSLKQIIETNQSAVWERIEQVEGMVGFYPLHTAAKCGNDFAIGLLVQQNIDVNLRCVSSSNNMTPLQVAVYYEQPDTVERLLALGADINLRCNIPLRVNCSTLMLACLTGNSSVLHLVLSHMRNNLKSSCSQFAEQLNEAIKYLKQAGNERILQRLIRFGTLCALHKTGSSIILHSQIVNVSRYIISFINNVYPETKIIFLQYSERDLFVFKICTDLLVVREIVTFFNQIGVAASYSYYRTDRSNFLLTLSYTSSLKELISSKKLSIYFSSQKLVQIMENLSLSGQLRRYADATNNEDSRNDLTYEFQTNDSAQLEHLQTLLSKHEVGFYCVQLGNMCTLTLTDDSSLPESLEKIHNQLKIDNSLSQIHELN